MASIYLASTVVMGLGTVVMVALLLVGRKWERYSPQGMTQGASGFLSDPRVWIIGFAVLALGAAGATIAILRSPADPTLLILAGFGLVIVGFLAVGTYFTARARGHPHSHAVGEAIAVLGGVMIVALVGNLLTSFGA